MRVCFDSAKDLCNEHGKHALHAVGSITTDNISSITGKSSRFPYILMKKMKKDEKYPETNHPRPQQQSSHESHSGENTIRPVKKCYATQFKLTFSSFGSKDILEYHKMI